MTRMPLFTYPTKTLWVDDDSLFLEAAKLAFKGFFQTQFYTSAIECLKFLKEYEILFQRKPFLKSNQDYEEYDLNTHSPVDIDIQAIHKVANAHSRLEEISVIIVDYNMPEKNGIELCRELKHLPIKKILLTGEASHQQAVYAFNEGIIDGFVSKDSSNLIADLLLQISKLKNNYFSEKTNHLLTLLETESLLPHSDPNFIELFQQLCGVNHFNEYYIIDKFGSLLLRSPNNNDKFFVIHTAHSLNKFCELYKDDKEVKSYITSIEQRQKIPFFGFNKEPWDNEFHLWEPFFHTPQVFEGRETYYWCILNVKFIPQVFS